MLNPRKCAKGMLNPRKCAKEMPNQRKCGSKCQTKRNALKGPACQMYANQWYPSQNIHKSIAMLEILRGAPCKNVKIDGGPLKSQEVNLARCVTFMKIHQNPKGRPLSNVRNLWKTIATLRDTHNKLMQIRGKPLTSIGVL